MINEDILDDLDDFDGSSNSNQEMEPEDIKEDPSTLSQHSQLLVNGQFLLHMKKISELIDQKIDLGKANVNDKKEDIELSNKYALEINREIDGITKFVKEIYDKKIPSLKGIVPNNALYARTILDIEQDIEHEGKEKYHYLTPQQRISIRLEASTPAENISPQEREKVLKASKIITILQTHYDQLMNYLQTCIKLVAPNLCSLLGSLLASKVVSAAGGIDKLVAMPACNIQVLGGTRSAEVGMSQLERNHTGLFGQIDVVKDAPKKFQMKLVRMLATNTAKCARADYLGTGTEIGARLHQQLYERFDKVQEEGGLMRVEKPMQIPDLQPKKKRGGKRHRKLKQFYEKSEMRKLQNRIGFNNAEEYIDMEQDAGLGMLKNGVGKLKIGIKKQKLNTSKKTKERMEKKSGLESSLNLSSNQGIEMINPALKQKKELGSESYFNKSSGFRTIINEKMMKK